MDLNERAEQAIRITYIGVAVNVALLAAKFAAGVLGNSQAMIADAVHTLSDFATDIAVLIGETAEPGLAKRPMLDEWLVFVTSPEGPKLPRRLPLTSLPKWPMVLPGQNQNQSIQMPDLPSSEQIALALARALTTN